MALTGWPFLVLLVVLAVAAFVALLVWWRRLAGGGPGPVAARAGAVLGVNLLVLLTAMTVANDQFLFFADWTDLRGAFGGARTAASLSKGGSAARLYGHPVGGAASAAPSPPPLPAGAVGGQVLTYRVTGRASGVTGTVAVELPPGYTDRAAAGRRYPVLETFSGYPGSIRQWIGPMRLGDVMSAEVAAHRMRPALIVSPQTEVPPGTDSECVNGSPGRPQVETWLAVDVPRWVAATFRVAPDRASWSTIGLSAGGWCAAMVAMLHPGQFGAAVVHGGYFRPEFGPLYDPYPPDSPLAVRYDLVRLVRRAPPPIAMWVETSHSDAVSYGSTAQLLKVTRAPIVVDALVLRHAGHRISLWQGLLPGSLDWLGRTVPGFAPG
jgi:hypothetical protein